MSNNHIFELSRCVIFDLECYPDRWCVGFRWRGPSGVVTTRIVEAREALAKSLTWFAGEGRILVGYNSERFDIPLVRGILAGVEPYAPAQSIIRDGKLPPAMVNLPKFPCDHIDLSARLRRGGAFPGLKTVAANLGRPVLCEVPFDLDEILTDAQWEEIKAYNRVDLEHTWALLERLAPELSALASLSAEFSQDLRSVSNPQVVERVFLSEYRKAHSRDPVRANWTEVRYRPLPGISRPRSWDAGDWLDKLVNEPIPMVPRGDRLVPGVPVAKFKIGNLALSVGAGGLHSIDSARVCYATRRHRLVSVDVASFYPCLIAAKGISPAAYSDTGRETYRSILERRLRIKKTTKTTDDPAERARLDVQATGLKLILNAFFGKTGDPYSTLYDPGAFLAVTLSGQLMLIDLIERLTDAKIRVLSANTDGLFLRIPRGHKSWRDVLKKWQTDTGMRLDVEPLKRLAILASNQYATRDTKNRVKRKGGELRGDLDWSHVPNMLVVNDAVAAALLFDVAPEKTIFACRNAERFCSVVKRSAKAVSMVLTDDRTEGELPRVTRWYKAKDSQRRIEMRFEGGRHTTPANARGVAICQDLPSTGLPADLDWAWYLGQARRKIQQVPGYRHRSKRLLAGSVPALEILQAGLLPVPKHGKRQPAGSDARHPTLLWDWEAYPTQACYTGALVNTLVVDVDEAGKFRQFVESGNSPMFGDRWKSLEGSLVSFHGNATADGVRSGKDRGKFIFAFAGGPDHPLCRAGSKWLKPRGIEVFYGNGIPSILGQYDDNGDRYRLDGSLGKAPEWLITELTPKTRVKRARVAALAPEAKQAALEGLPAELAGVDPRLGDPAISWRRKELSDGREIWVGHCPFASEHDSGQSGDADLSAGVHDDGPYLKCFHSSCSKVREINRRLKRRFSQSRPLPSPSGQAAAGPSPVANGAPVSKTEVALLPRPEIELTTERHLVRDEAVKALVRDERLFYRGDVLVMSIRPEESTIELPGGVELRQANGAPRVVPIDEPNLGCLLTENAAFFIVRPDKHGEMVTRDAHPPDWLIRAVRAKPAWPGIRPLLTLAECPYVKTDGSIADRAGYDPSTGTLLIPAFDLPKMPDRPTQAEAKAAVKRLRDRLHQFPFAAERDFAVWLADFLTSIQRPVIEGPVPGFAYTGNKAGCGKGLLIDCKGIAVWGGRIPTMCYPIDKAEGNKVVLALALGGVQVVHFDNLQDGQSYGMSALDSALTTTICAGRVLGLSKCENKVPLRPCWNLSGNNLTPEGDAHRRWLPCNLRTDLERPYERGDFDIKNLRAHVAANRAEIVADGLIILRAHAIAGRPAHGQGGPLGSFEEWDGVVRSPVWFATDIDCVRGLREAADNSPKRLDHLALLEAWANLPEGTAAGYTCTEVLAMADQSSSGPDQSSSGPTYPELRAALMAFGMEGNPPDSRRLGYKMRSMKNANAGGRAFAETGAKRNNTAVWCVKTLP
jgi:putative DNA primase/helicase